MVYQWVETRTRSSLDAQTIGNRLEALRRKHKGLTPEVVVDDARNPKSPMHGAFEWDDTTAAEQYRLEQARNLVRCIVYVPEGVENPQPIRAFVHVTQTNGHTRSVYQSTSVALSDEEMRAQVLARAKAELASCANRYRHLSELAEVLSAIDNIAA